MASIPNDLQELKEAYIQHVKAALNHKIKEVDDALANLRMNSPSSVDVRMACVQETLRCRGSQEPDTVIAEAEKLATFILTGKKPGEA